MRQLGPGTVLTGRSLERAFELGLHSYELHRRRHKLRWTTATRTRARIQAFPPSLVGTVAHLAADRGQALYRRMRGREPPERLDVA